MVRRGSLLSSTSTSRLLSECLHDSHLLISRLLICLLRHSLQRLHLFVFLDSVHLRVSLLRLRPFQLQLPALHGIEYILFGWDSQCGPLQLRLRLTRPASRGLNRPGARPGVSLSPLPHLVVAPFACSTLVVVNGTSGSRRAARLPQPTCSGRCTRPRGLELRIPAASATSRRLIYVGRTRSYLRPVQ